jgi:hypothetical protein
MGQLIPSINYHWQAEDYLTIWNADKHINDAGGYGTYGCTNFGAYTTNPENSNDPQHPPTLQTPTSNP